MLEALDGTYLSVTPHCVTEKYVLKTAAGCDRLNSGTVEQHLGLFIAIMNREADDFYRVLPKVVRQKESF